MQSHRQPHQTLKWSLGSQQREFWQFTNGLGYHDLFSSLTFSPAPEFGIVFTHFMLVHCIFPWTVKDPVLKYIIMWRVCTVVLWLIGLCKNPKWLNLDLGLNIILISLFDNSRLPSIMYLRINFQPNRQTWIHDLYFVSSRNGKAVSIPFIRISEMSCWPHHLLPNQLWN